MFAVLANLLTLARLGLGIAFPWIPPELRLAVVAAGAASDFLDGAWSRMWGATTTFGRVLDPVADKVFTLSVIGTLCHEGRISLWQVLLLILRDLAVVAGGFWFLILGQRKLQTLRPRWPGKFATTFQFLFLLSLLIWPGQIAALFWSAVATTVWAAVDYLIDLTRPAAAVSEP